MSERYDFGPGVGGHGRRGLRLADLLTVGDETDESGRLLLEDSAPKQARKRAERAGIAMTTERSQYTDTPSRVGGLMNAAAYEALRHDTGPILDGFAWLAHGYLRLDPSRRSTAQALFDTSNLGLMLPLVLFHRAVDPVPPHGALPTYVASIFKASRGVFSAAVDLLNKAGPGPTTAAGIVQFAEEHGHLRRAATGRVCAAPTRLIERTLAVVITGEGAEPERSGLAGLVRFDDLWAFYRLQETFNQAVSRYRSVHDHLVEALGSRDLAAMAEAVIEDGGRRYAFAEYTGFFLELANTVQADLNQLLGRDDGGPELTFEAALRLL